ncbi:MAG: glucose 1-dehydrogenase [Paenibacillaceae bacterium]|uniref:Glucose 1-dehydrogenase n=1 Tax=Paenibacillus mellifer TaxID=2937794 RepID=A0A9X1XVS0_9BACL|nr:glucose 1-dehydrogenase [Paenibacillus mellifer]MBW4840891.1 glucose 1-dehydrogenase [Paenibacillaceae bacterium]MCK8486925.1 glucose 1-dehydrogenase [Paenibacillus mellifer]
MGKLAGKVALITGGSSGIGFSTAQLFLDEGAKVVITGRNPDNLKKAVEALDPANSIGVVSDASDPGSAEKAAAAAVEAFGGLDIVFANAGISGSTPLGSTDPSLFKRILDINVAGVFFTIQAASPHLREGGSVILNGSVLAKAGSPGYAAYAASKGAVTSMARVLVSELAPRGIRVNTVVPGATRTPIWGDTAAPAFNQLEDYLKRSIPLNRMGEPIELANTVLFLASDDSSFVNGAEISVDGGSGSSPMGTPLHVQR